MSKSLIRKNQLHPDISDLVRDYGSNFFVDSNNLEVTGSTLQNQINNLGNTYVTRVSGEFNNRPTVNGTGILLSGEAAQVDLSSTVRTTGNQTISGVKNFASRPTVNGTVVFLSGDSFVAPNFNSAPANPVMGQIYFDTNSNNFSGYNGTNWTRLNN